MPTAVAAANAVPAWPDGNEVESGIETRAWIAGSASGGRARSVRSFTSTVMPSATAAAPAAASAAVGSARRLAASQQPLESTAVPLGKLTSELGQSASG